MDQETRSKVWQIVSGLIKVGIFLALIIAFKVHGDKIGQFQDRCWSIHGWMNAVFEEKQAEAYKIVQHLRVEYPLMTIIERGNEIPQVEIKQVFFHDSYPVTTSPSTEFISNFLHDLINNEASLFYAQHQRVPTDQEMAAILADIAYYGYLQSLQFALFELEWKMRRTSHPNNFSGNDLGQLEKLRESFTQDQKRVEEILAKNPSEIKFIQVYFVKSEKH